MENASWIAVAVFAADQMIRVGLSIRVIMRRRPVGASLAWLTVVLLLPFLGALVYLLIGEPRLGRRRAARAAAIHEPYEKWLSSLRQRCHVDWTRQGAEAETLARITEAAVGIPAMSGGDIQLIDDAPTTFQMIIADIDAAERTCHLEFYIWNVGGTADDVAEALLRAAGRGVICRVLVDAVGSKDFLRSDLASKLRDGGVRLTAALPVGLFQMLFVRFDLRLHRKIVVIDGHLAYTGSMNMVDPRYFKQGSGVGQWVDAMVRVQGPAVEALAITFIEDWELETGEGLEQLRQTGDARPLPELGHTAIQVVPSGPTIRSDAIQEILLMAIYASRRELVLTTPYFVPEELLLKALISAANRGVDVTIIVPARVDSLLVRYASQAHKDELLAAGVRIMLFEGGLLHTKSITIDGEMSLFGSLNLDPRSLQLNFEITLVIYDAQVVSLIRSLQQTYLDQSRAMDLAAWRARSALEQFAESTARLLSPLL